MGEDLAARAPEAYEAPALRELGDVSELTAGLPGGSVTDLDDN